MPVNWWNMMETTFGAVWGGVLAFGVWWNQSLIAEEKGEPLAADDATATDSNALSPAAEFGLLALHVISLVMWTVDRFAYGPFDDFGDLALTMIWIPAVAVVGGRYWAYFMCLPLTLLPIALKTLRHVEPADQITYWICAVVPIAVTSCVAIFWCIRPAQRYCSRHFAAATLVLMTWTYFALNSVIFQHAWPWDVWTSRTPNQTLFLMAAAVITLGCCLPTAAPEECA